MDKILTLICQNSKMKQNDLIVNLTPENRLSERSDEAVLEYRVYLENLENLKMSGNLKVDPKSQGKVEES